MHIATFLKVILPIAFLVDGTVSTPTLNERNTGEATIKVYTLPKCDNGGKEQKSKIYQLADGACVNTAPVPKVNGVLKSYEIALNPGVTASPCFLDVYPYKNCTGNYSGLQPGKDNANKCQNVEQGFTGETETQGAKSVRITCAKPCK